MVGAKYLLIGGGLAAVRAAQQIAMVDAGGSIVLVSDEPVLPYDRPPLSKSYLGSPSEPLKELLSPAELASGRLRCELSRAVVELDPGAKTARLQDGGSIGFDRALIATGGRPATLETSGARLAGIHYLRTASDADAIRMDAMAGSRVVIVGGGFIGLELAAALRQRGLEVTVVEALSRVWARFGNELLSKFVTDLCEARGIRFLAGTTISAFEGDGRVRAVVTDAGERLACDLVCVGVGIKPNVELAAAAGLMVSDGVVVDARMQTSAPDIFAAGDVINYPDPVFSIRRRVEHWGHAEHSGQVAGRNMAGGDEVYDLLSYVWSDVFDMHLEFAGDERDHDAQVVRGRPEDGAFTIIYLKAGRPTAFFAINQPAREYAAIRRLIQTRADLAGREAYLEDPSANLRALLKSG
jgi:NADPH-dependent 2,4-dienoyl-CoA reductase/sulfur reductase-like enzyme